MNRNIGAHYLDNIIKHLKTMKINCEKSFTQVEDYEKFHWTPNRESNSLSILIRHFTGNMKSRWTDFLTTDGEKPSRKRDSEFDETLKVDKEDLIKEWEEAWKITLESVSNLKESDLLKTVYIRNEAHTVVEAINRQILHYAAHFSQIMYLVKLIVNENWISLSIPKRK